MSGKGKNESSTQIEQTNLFNCLEETSSSQITENKSDEIKRTVRGYLPSGYWTEERCLEVAKLCISKNEMRSKYSGAYYAAKKHDWLNNYTWFKKPEIKIKWTKEACFEAVKECLNMSEFRHKYKSAYQASKKGGWFEEISKLFEHKPQITYQDITFELCCKISKNCQTLNQFIIYYPLFYKKAITNKWLDKFTWLKTKQDKKKPEKNWTFEKVIDCALQCQTKKEFKKKFRGAYEAAYKNKWIDKLDFLVSDKFQWTFEKCKEVIEKCATLKEFTTKYHQAYSKCVREKWLDKLIDSSKRHITYYTDEQCIEEAKKYKTLTEFRQNNIKLYFYAKRHNLLKTFTWLKEIDKFHTYRHIYGYFFEEYKTAYVGLTNNIKRRDKQHKGLDNICKAKSAVYDFSQEKNCEIPEIVILEELLTEPEAKVREQYWIDYYKKQGWHMLNSAKAGSLGSSFKKISEKECFDIAQKYTNREEFKEKEPDIYHICLKRGYLNTYDWLDKIKHIRTFEECYEIAKKYKTRKEFKEKDKTVYNYSMIKGYIKKFDWMPPMKYKTYEDYYNIALQFKSTKEFREAEPKVFKKCTEKGYMKNFTWLEKERVFKHNYESCYQKALQYDKLSDFRKNANKAYICSVKNNFLKDFTWLKEKVLNKDNPEYKEAAYQAAKECKTRTEFKEKYLKYWRAAKQNGWIEDYDWFEIKHKSWSTFEEAYEIAKKYQTLEEFKTKESHGYSICKKKGYLDKFDWLE